MFFLLFIYLFLLLLFVYYFFYDYFSLCYFFLYKSFFSFLFFYFFYFFYIQLSFAKHEVILAKRIRISCHSVLLKDSLNAHVAFVSAQQKF